MTVRESDNVYLRDLGHGLVLRRATPADAEALGDLNARILSDFGPDQPEPGLAGWTRDLVTRPHPTMQPGDVTVVEDTATGRLVSTCSYISQVWTYGGIPFGVGRPEMVSTEPDYRRRGLVRAQFEVMHQWAAERNHLVQVITGIPNFYRQFGYEMAINLGGRRSLYEAHVPKLNDGAAEPYRVRPATPDDLPFVASVYEAACQRSLVACVRDAALWRYELDGRSADNLNNSLIAVVESAAGEPVGYIVHSRMLVPTETGMALALWGYELKPGTSWLAVTPSVLRCLWAAGQAQGQAEGKPVLRVSLALGAEHPVYDAYPNRLTGARPPYAWYVRVPDLPGFLRLVAPVLEQRLAQSLAAGHTGELKISFYHSGLRLALESGRLATVEPWQPTVEDGGHAAFPNLTFLQLLFGHRSLDELRQAYADCGINSEDARALLMALFPRQNSNVWGVV